MPVALRNGAVRINTLYLCFGGIWIKRDEKSIQNWHAQYTYLHSYSRMFFIE